MLCHAKGRNEIYRNVCPLYTPIILLLLLFRCPRLGCVGLDLGAHLLLGGSKLVLPL